MLNNQEFSSADSVDAGPDGRTTEESKQHSILSLILHRIVIWLKMEVNSSFFLLKRIDENTIDIAISLTEDYLVNYPLFLFLLLEMRTWKHYAFSLFDNLAFSWINFHDPKSSGIFGMNSKRMWWMNDASFFFRMLLYLRRLAVIHIVVFVMEGASSWRNKQAAERAGTFLLTPTMKPATTAEIPFFVLPDRGRRCHLQSSSRAMVLWRNRRRQRVPRAAAAIQRDGSWTHAADRVWVLPSFSPLYVGMQIRRTWSLASLVWSRTTWFLNRYHQFVPPEVVAMPRNSAGENNFMLGWVPWPMNRKKKKKKKKLPFVVLLLCTL